MHSSRQKKKKKISEKLKEDLPPDKLNLKYCFKMIVILCLLFLKNNKKNTYLSDYKELFEK